MVAALVSEADLSNCEATDNRAALPVEILALRIVRLSVQIVKLHHQLVRMHPKLMKLHIQ